MKKLWNKIIDKLFGKRCKCAEKKPKQNKYQRLFDTRFYFSPTNAK